MYIISPVVYQNQAIPLSQKFDVKFSYGTSSQVDCCKSGHPIEKYGFDNIGFLGFIKL